VTAPAKAQAKARPTLDAAQIDLRGVGKAFRSKGRSTVALTDVNLTVAPGELVCLLGSSGCGKSTLLRVLAGTLEPDEGTVRVGGAPVEGPSPDRGMLFQSPMLFDWLTTRKNVLFGPYAQRSRGRDRRPDTEIESDVNEILDTVGLARFADSFPHQLSGGMRHRAAFARAIVTRPSLLLMDEPFGALDAITRLRMQEFLLSLWERYRMTILFVTHDIEEAVLLGDRVAIMASAPGRIRETIEIPLARPRQGAVVDTEAFLVIKRRIRAALEL
jgi:NitT/TauT family transport system ATP-binding protein